MPIIENDATTLPELVEKVLGITSALPDRHFLWFRGHRCSTFELVPKMMREGKTADEIYKREGRLLTRFRQRSLAYWPSGYPQKNWEHFFAMQHYGLPTRLLDWSENLFVAAHFALDGGNISSHTHSGDCRPVIWCIDPISWNRSMPYLSGYGDQIHVCTIADEEIESYEPLSKKKSNKHPIAIFGTHNSQRIVTQRGTFVVWGYESVSMENLANSLPVNIWKINLTGDALADLVRLQSLGFAETMIFPELTELSKELSRTEGW